jgi:secretion/DNA translocation related CpaE-like protein
MRQQHRPFLLTTDTDLLDDLLGAAAAVGAAVDVGVEPAACRPQWTDAPLVLLGSDLVGAALAAHLWSRPDVLLVTRGAPTPELRHAAGRLGVEGTIALPNGEPALLERLADVVEPPARPAEVVAVVAGRGGAGASALAAGLALTAAAQGAPAWLIDLDALGGGADAGLGAEMSTGVRWADLDALTGRLSPRTLRSALADVLGVAVLAADGRPGSEPASEAVRAVIAAASRGPGTVVLDLPRHRTTARDAALAMADDILVVVPGELRAVLAARRVIEGLSGGSASPRAIVRIVPSGLPSREVAQALQLSLAGELADEIQVRTALQLGDANAIVRGTALATLCETLLDERQSLRVAA